MTQGRFQVKSKQTLQNLVLLAGAVALFLFVKGEAEKCNEEPKR